MTDADYDYWEISIGEAFDDAEIDLPSEKKFKRFVESIKDCAEMQHECMGYDHIPNPQTLEIEKLKQQIEKTQNATSNREQLYQDKITSRYKYPGDYTVEIRDGRIEINRIR